MKKAIINIIKYITTFFILIGCFNLLLYLVCSFNSKALKENINSSYEFLQKQGNYHLISKSFNVYNNNCTEAVILNEAYSVDNNFPYESYMKARKNYQVGITTNEILEPTGEGVTINYSSDTGEEIYNTGYNPIGELGDFLNGDLHSAMVYGRYWHGYLVLYRPLLLIFNIVQIKVLHLVVYIGLFIWLMFLLSKRFNKNISLIFGLSLLCSGYFSAAYSLESTPIFLVTLISSIILLIRLDKIKNFYLFVFIVGCVANFVDYLTVPLISFGMIYSIYFLKLYDEKNDWKYCLKHLIISSLIWLLGYAGTWIFKWILYDLTINDDNNMLSIGFTQSFYRMKRVNENASRYYNIITCLIELVGNSSLYIIITTGIILVVNRFKVLCNGLNKKALPFWFLSLYPIVWYIILINHTLIHYYFTYRLLLLFMLGTLLFLYKLFFNKNKSKVK